MTRQNFLIPVLSFILIINVKIRALENGVARTPPMGWLSWQRFECQLDCDTYPDDCISEQLYMSMADRLVSDGFKDVGYEYVLIDDCWSENKRDPLSGRLIANRKRFPNGIRALADYVHSKGLKLGIYGDAGRKTCGGWPGSAGYYDLDAQTFAEWRVDSVKFDGCYANISEFSYLYPSMAISLNNTNRPMLFSCSWPAYQDEPDYDLISYYCNLWRNYYDIYDSWESVSSIIDYYGVNQELFSYYNRPGAWNDPDMLVIGNFGLSLEQSKAQMALWSMWSSPLYMSNDLRDLRPEHKKILQNKYVIAVNQNPLGIMAQRVYSNSQAIEIWAKPITPVINDLYSYAIVYLNRWQIGGPKIVSRTLSSIIGNQTCAAIYNVYDLFENSKLIAKLSIDNELSLKVNNAGGVRMVRVTPARVIRSLTC